MNAPQIKICGLSTAETLEAAIAGRADYAGLNFYPPSPRFVTPGQAGELARQAAGRLQCVGVFVDPSNAQLAEVLAAAPLDALQFHGDETPERLAQVRQQFGLPVWKALPIASRADLDRVVRYVEAADFVLLDAKTPKGTLPGGMGLSFDWSLLAGWQASLPWGLAGGLNPDNVAAAIAATAAPLIDCSSGVESAPGIKDSALIARFCQAVRG
ncbi:MAG: phosphoribosylanthranilate isomerase [Novosphingobium sp.]|nr:phosphoribosylanthranilate isomerase [Novosphingobium sp.]